MTATLDLHLKRVLSDYTGREVLSVAVVRDPHYMNTYAVQAMFGRSLDLQTSFKTRRAAQANTCTQFLIKHRLLDATVDDLEDVVFATWPPEVRS